MSLWGDILKIKEEDEKEYCEDVSIYSENNLIYSDEPYEFRVIGGTPDGKIVIPNKMICIPCYVRKTIIEKKSVTIKDSKIIGIEEIKKNNEKYIEVRINYRIVFNVRLYDLYNNICKIMCYIDKYPTPGKQSFTKEFIRAYSIVSTKLLIKCNDENYEPNVVLSSNAWIKDANCRLYKQKKFISCYNVNCEAYIKLLVGIIISRCVKISWDKK